MSYTNKILRFLDEEMNLDEKTEFVKEMSENNELRDEFNQISLIRKEVSKHNSSIPAPSFIKNNIEKSLLFNSKVAIFSFISTLIVTGALIINLSSSDIPNEVGEASYSENIFTIDLPHEKIIGENPEQNENTLNYESTIIERSGEGIPQKLEAEKLEVQSNKLEVKGKELDKYENDNSELSDQVFAMKDIGSTIISSDKRGGGRLNIPNSGTNVISKEYQLFSKSININSSNIKMYLDYSSINRTKYFDIAPSQDWGNLLGLGLSMEYKLNNTISLGSNLRAESFFQEYILNDDGIYFQARQNPNLITLSAYTKAHLRFNSFSTFYQIDFGANKAGLVLRNGVGVSVPVFNNIDLILRGDYSNLFFNELENRYTSNNINLSVGVGYQF